MKGLIAGRALQGVAGGGCVQLVTVTISDLFGMRKRSLVLGMMEGVWYAILFIIFGWDFLLISL